MHDESARVRAAREADRAELVATYRDIVRSVEDAAALMIAEYETATGMRATEADWDEARRCVREGYR